MTATAVSELRIMDKSGDTRVTWTVGNEIEESIARSSFDAFHEKGYLAYRLDTAARGRGTQMREFDPSAGTIIMAPPLAGG